MTDIARLIGSLVCRVLGPIVNACFYPDGLVLLGGAASVFTWWCWSFFGPCSVR
jgi:hypothetical protein